MTSPTRILRRATAVLTLATGLAGLSAGAVAQTASAKATFAYSNLTTLPACSSAGVSACNSVANDSDWKTILRQQIKLTNQKDLFLGASLQCGIVTDSTVKSLNSSLDGAEARATIRVRIKVTAPNGAVSFAQPSSGVDATQAGTDGVVFCVSRADPRRQVLGAELLCRRGRSGSPERSGRRMGTVSPVLPWTRAESHRAATALRFRAKVRAWRSSSRRRSSGCLARQISVSQVPRRLRCNVDCHAVKAHP